MSIKELKKYPLVRLAVTFAVIAAVFVAMKPLFMLCNLGAFSGVGASGWLSVMAHGLPMDLCVAGYLTAIPALLFVASIWAKGRWLNIVATAYCVAIALLVGGIAVTDAALYPYWGFRLDMTPIFYFTTSPSAVIGGLSASQFAGGLVGWILVSATLFVIYRFAVVRMLMGVEVSGRRRWVATALSVLGLAALFIPIRGGFTVSTMNPSRAYFSDNQRLNHAALNPAFSLLYSASHQHGLSRQFRYMDADVAASALTELDAAYFPADSLAAEPLLTAERPDIYLIILESFSAHLLPSMGGEPIAPRLDSIAANGLAFSNFYANSFRTDRALASILGSFPAMPTASVMKRVDKIERLPSWSRRLRDHGYSLAYYYGGDVNFTNMKALLVSNGFSKIVCDADFPVGQRLGKWGAHDDVLFDRVMADVSTTSDAPVLRVVQTSSSHEPFEAPYTKLADPAANAFAFTDSVLGRFIDNLSQSPRWPRTLVAIVADHYGCYPHDITDPAARHHIPLILSGGALSRKGIVDTFGTQVDLAATILAALGIPAGGIPYSHNLLAPPERGFAFFTDPDAATILTPDSRLTLNIQSGGAEGDTLLATPTKAFLQTIYQDYDN